MSGATHEVLDVNGCGEVAFYLVRESDPVCGEVLHASQVRLLDGSTPALHSVMRCGACSRMLSAHDLRVEHVRKASTQM
jgi:hypothetical protein